MTSEIKSPTLPRLIFRECIYNHHQKCLNRSGRCECDCHVVSPESLKIRKLAERNTVLNKDCVRLQMENQRLRGKLEKKRTWWKFW